MSSAGDNYVLASHPDSTAAGYSIDIDAGRMACRLSDGTNTIHIRSNTTGVMNDGKAHIGVCTFSWSGAAWSGVVYIDGLSVAATTDTNTLATNTINNSGVLSMASFPVHASPYRPTIGEVYVTKTALSAEQVLAQYRQTTQQGTYWTDDANVLLHYKMNEAAITNGVGLRDHSGNGNHLTVVNRYPTPQYTDLPWPAGSGLTKSNVYYGDGCSHDAAVAATANPDHQQPYSIIAWVRNPTGGGYYVAKNYPNTPSFVLWSNSFIWKVSDGTHTNSFAASINDRYWHMLAAKVTWDGNSWVSGLSKDGAAFTNVDSGFAGDPSGNAGVLKLGDSSGAGGTRHTQLAGVMIVKNYALTDADVAAYYKAGANPNSTVTYARTNGACYEVGNDPVAGIRTRCFQANEFPFAYNASSVTIPGNGRLGFGEPIHSAVTNYQQYGENADSWTLARVTVTANANPSPSGLKIADSVYQTVDNASHYIVQDSNLGAVALNADVVHSCYLKAGNGVTWVSCGMGESTSDARCFQNVNLSTGVLGVGNTSDAGHFTFNSASVVGVGGGWLRVTVSCKAVHAAERTIRGYVIELDADQATGWSDFVGNVAYYVQFGGFQSHLGTSWPGVYCPTTTAASATCNATSANYVASANLTGWDRSEGIISTVQLANNSGGLGIEISNAINNNGHHYIKLPDSQFYIYDNAGTLKQRLSMAGPVATPQVGVPLGIKAIFDSAEAVTGGTCSRSYGAMYYSLYAGPYDTCTTDSGANWTPGTGTNLYLGTSDSGSTLIEGLHFSTTISKTR
jgi:hypothetical protein